MYTTFCHFATAGHTASRVTSIQIEGNGLSSATVVLEKSSVPPTEKITGDPNVSGSYLDLVDISQHICSG
jgi:hypothetical protein